MFRLGGLSPWELFHRTVRESWQDDVFGQSGRMAFYHFLAIFPSLLVFLAISARIPSFGDPMRHVLQDLSRQILPDQVSQLFQRMVDELMGRALSGVQVASVWLGASWAALNGTWAMIDGLNTAYEVKENRAWWELAMIIFGLTISLAVTGAIAVFLIFCGAHLQDDLVRGAGALRIVEWLVLTASLAVSFAVLYRFAPNLRNHGWRRSAAGVLCAVLLWIGSTFLARIYFDHVNNYARSYGHLNGVVMLLLWLYITNGAILIGGEMNSEIEKAAAQRGTRPESQQFPG